MGSIKNLHQVMVGRSDKDIFRLERSFTFPCRKTWVGIGHTLSGNGFTLQVRNQHGTSTLEHTPQVEVEDLSSCENEMDKSLLEEVDKCESVIGQNIFHIELESSCEMNQNQNALNMELSFSTEVDHDYLVLQQEVGSTDWRDITNQCKTRENGKNIEIPVKKSSRVWVIRLKKGFGKVKYNILKLFCGEVLFHILVYYCFNEKQKNVDVRIIGISDELYQNPTQQGEPETIAEKEKFVKGKECVAKQLLRKGTLNVGLYKSDECVNEENFDMGRNSIKKSAEWFDFSFDLENLNHSMEVKVKDDNETLWRVKLNKILNDVVNEQTDACKQPIVQITKPELHSVDDEVRECHIPWLAHHLNRDVEKCAMLLMVDSNEIERIKQQYEDVEKRKIEILLSWRKQALNSEYKPKWNDIIEVIKSEDVRRFDVIRALLGKEEISDKVLLWIARRSARFFELFVQYLGVKDYEVEMAHHNSDGCEEMKRMSVMKRWREISEEPTVEDLIKALESDIVQQKQLAQEMKKAFCQTENMPRAEAAATSNTQTTVL
ncbi:uncharacterized protein LOC114520316 isoform X2 [Dendronephthya gigantea]|nr:uncharacterized protein LOC114520316 isoform X2 [Dendronephthya gigantea]XP_028396362.1 uncharacterized protein LOC114520316 isoform X2 [Dendronephthya gigantea]XP_028396363.1 uncharacterized protein LOC114520316 isoform X2 [Dendronephthya gigantea]